MISATQRVEVELVDYYRIFCELSIGNAAFPPLTKLAAGPSAGSGARADAFRNFLTFFIS
jgi:hypothetical protein